MIPPSKPIKIIKKSMAKDIPRATDLSTPTLERKYTTAASLVPIPATVTGITAINIIMGTKIKK